MSSFAVPLKRIRAIEAHPNADAIEFAVIDGYRSIVRKGEFAPGDLIAYIPEGALLPAAVLKQLKLWDEDKGCGRLNGKDGHRVKAVKLRGELSQGLCLAFAPDVELREGDDMAGRLGITKYEPPIPVCMAGEVFNAGQELTLGFDVENWKSYPDILRDGESVIFTEKLHGTCTVMAILPYRDAHPEAFGERKNLLVFSKGLGAKGLVFKNNSLNVGNLYVRATGALLARIDALQRDDDVGVAEPLFLLGETFGPGVQDLSYGKALGFRVFAAARGYRGDQRYEDWSTIEGPLRQRFGFETVPVLYRGPFSLAAMHAHTDGGTTLDAGHIREGIVMVPAVERFDPAIGRVCLKSVSTDYLTRKGGTEFN